MSVVIDVILVLHLIGVAAIIGSWLANPRDPAPRPAMVWGARAQLVTGLVLVGLHQMSTDPDEKLNMVTIGVKLLVALAVAGLVETAAARALRASDGTTDPVAHRDGDGTTLTATRMGLVQVAALLAIVNVCVAVLWH